MASTYKLVDLPDSDDEDVRPPPRENLFAAARFMATVFEANKLPHAFMGGFSMICRGLNRETRDIDVVVEAGMRTVFNVIEVQPRLKIPNTRLLESIIKVFVHTGPKYGDDECKMNCDVETDIMVAGSMGTPRTLENYREQLVVAISGQEEVFEGLNTLYMMRTKLRTFSTREARKDFDDLFFMLSKFGDKIGTFAKELNADERQFLLQKMRGQIKEETLNKFATLLAVEVDDDE